MSKFYTTNSKLYNNNNGTNMPDWMKDFTQNIKEKEKKNIDLSFETKGSFVAEKMTVNRPDLNSTPRDIIADLNNEKLEIDAKVKLAKFLMGKYYKTNTRIAGKNIYLDTNIDGLQAGFTFMYKGENGRIIECSTFMVNDSEYPFSKAGFDECLMDLKNGTLKQSNTKIASTRQTYVINREEIIRRYNGSLREATDAINGHLKEGNIVGAGSNSYASFIDPIVLFPQKEKEKPEAPQGSFEYVDNQEHVKTNEYKSAKNLSLEASKILSNLFNDFIIQGFVRDNNELLIKATVLSKTGIRHNINFNFDIKNEKVDSLKLAETNDERMSIEQLINKLNMNNNVVKEYLKTSMASKRIYKGSVLTKKEIKSKLQNIVAQNKVEDFIDSWISLNKIKPINSTTYISDNSFEELLDMIVVETLTDSEKEKLMQYKKKFGEGLDINRIEEKDTGIREVDDVELNREYKLNKINSALSKYFKNYQIIGFNDNIINAQFKNNGVRHTIKLISKFNGRKLDKINAVINDKEISLNNLTKAFKSSSLLNEYLQNSDFNNFSNSIIATESNLLNRLSLIAAKPIDVLNNWKKHYLKNIGGSLYTSEYSFEELLNKTNAQIITENDKKQISLAKQHFGKSFERIATNDNDTRNMISRITDETLLYEANNYLSKHFANYSPIGFNSIKQGLKDNAKYTIALFDEDTGLSNNIDFILLYENGKLKSCKALINNNELEVSNIKKAFAMNEALSRYLQVNAGKKVNAPMVITKNDLSRRLNKITNADKDEVESIIENWKNYGKIHNLDNNTFASKLSLEQLISMSNIKPLSDKEIIEKLDKGRRDKGFSIKSSHIEDNDTRQIIDTWTSEQKALHARSEIGNMFKDFDIINAEVSDNNYIITARIVNPTNGLKQCLKFLFNTYNGVKLGNIDSIGNNEKFVKPKYILELLQSNNEAVNKFTQLNKANNKSHKNIISKSNFKSKLIGLIDYNNYDNIINKLVISGILNPIDNNNFASEYSLSEMVEYLSNNDVLNIKMAENKLQQYNKDVVVDTNIKHVQDCDFRKLVKKEEKLSPKMIETTNKIKKVIISANNNKKITNNKKDSLLNTLKDATKPNDIEYIWKELKKYI